MAIVGTKPTIRRWSGDTLNISFVRPMSWKPTPYLFSARSPPITSLPFLRDVKQPAHAILSSRKVGLPQPTALHSNRKGRRSLVSASLDGDRLLRRCGRVGCYACQSEAGKIIHVVQMMLLVRAAFLRLAFPLRLDQRKLQLPLQRLHAIQHYMNAVSDREHPPRTLSHDLASIFVIHVAVAGQRVDRHQPLDKELLQFHEKAEFRRADNQRVEIFADSLLHEFGFLPFHEFALGIRGPALGFGAVVADG